VDLSARTKGGAVMLLRSPLIVAMDLFLSALLVCTVSQGVHTLKNCFKLLAWALLSAIVVRRDD